MRIATAAVAALLGALPAQVTQSSEWIEIAVRGEGREMRFNFAGTGTHTAADGRKVGEFRDGVYTCWHRDGWKFLELAYRDGIELTTFTPEGKTARTLRSERLAPAWHPNGRAAFVADGGRVRFWNDDGTVAAEARPCQEIWRVWGTDVELDEWDLWDVWDEMVFARHAWTVLPVLVRGIEHPDDWVRAHACAALPTFERHAAVAVPALRRVLAGDPSWLVRQRAADLLRQLGALAHEAVPELAATVRNRDERELTRWHAALALGEIGPRAAVAVPALEEAAKLGPPVLSVAAIEALGWIDPQDRPTDVLLVERLGQQQTKQFAADALWRRRQLAGDVAKPLHAALAACGEDLTALARALARPRSHGAPELPRPAWHEDHMAADDARPVLRTMRIEPAALLAFCMVDADPDEIEPVLALLTDCEGSLVRSRLADHLRTLGPDAAAAVPGLVHLLAVGSFDTPEWVRDALARIGPPAIPALVARLEAKDGGWRNAHAVEALGMMGAPAAAALVRWLGAKEPWLQANAAAALGRLGPAAADALPALRALRANAGPELREAIAEAVARIEGPR